MLDGISTLQSGLDFTLLSAVKNITWIDSNMDGYIFPSAPILCQSVTIRNTALLSIHGLFGGSIDTLNIIKNEQLTDVNLPLESITSSLFLAKNGGGGDSTSTAYTFPNLTWAANMTVFNTSQLSVPSLMVVNGSLGLYGNTFDSFSAPKLSSVGNVATGVGRVDFDANLAMTGLYMPLLVEVGGTLSVTFNDKLAILDLVALARVGGALDLSGAFST